MSPGKTRALYTLKWSRSPTRKRHDFKELKGVFICVVCIKRLKKHDTVFVEWLRWVLLQGVR